MSLDSHSTADNLHNRPYILPSVEKMIAYHILDQDVEIPDGIKCKDRDWLLRELYRKEFSAQQLVIMFGLSNVNSVYVKSCRINKKIKTAKSNIVKKEPAPKAKKQKIGVRLVL